MTRGYFNRPEKTAEVFLDSPYSSGKIYRTGDLVCWTDQGELKYLGRRDNQVKLRGFRIELGEIEAVLGTHPAIGENVASVVDNKEGDARLVLYYVADQNQTAPKASELREFLSKQLPAYMLPQHFLKLERWPRKPNGKIDRSALPVPSHLFAQSAVTEPAASSTTSNSTPVSTEGQSSDESVATATETEILALWKKHVGATELQLTDNFLDIGGHSLLAVRIQHELNKQYDINIGLRAVMLHSLSELAAEVDRLREEGGDTKQRSLLDRLLGRS